VNARGTVYTVQLKPASQLQEWPALTSADVAFTYHTIQNPDAQSPFQSSWTGIKIAAPTPDTVTFTLPNPLSAFPYSLTTRHCAGAFAREGANGRYALRRLQYHQSGGRWAFAWQTLQVSGNSTDNQTEQVALKPFAHYYGGTPKLDGLWYAPYRTGRYGRQLPRQEITAMVGLSDEPSEVKKDSGVQAYSFPLSAAVMTFFQMTQGPLADSAVRHALVQAADVNNIIQRLGYPTKPVREPLLMGQLGFNAAYAQVDIAR